MLAKIILCCHAMVFESQFLEDVVSVDNLIIISKLLCYT